MTDMSAIQEPTIIIIIIICRDFVFAYHLLTLNILF